MFAIVVFLAFLARATIADDDPYRKAFEGLDYLVIVPEVKCKKADCSSITLTIKVGTDEIVASLYKRSIVTPNYRSQAARKDQVIR